MLTKQSTSDLKHELRKQKESLIQWEKVYYKNIGLYGEDFRPLDTTRKTIEIIQAKVFEIEDLLKMRNDKKNAKKKTKRKEKVV